MVKAQVAPAQIGRVELLVEFAAHFVKRFRRRALEREDRLLLVADREKRAPDIGPRAAAGVNSATMVRTMLHCFGLVSCASSISTWSMPRSSL